MQLPMTGSWSVHVKAVRLYTIHGDIYYELHARRIDAEGGEFLLRLPQHAAKTPPVEGQNISVSFLMGQVTAISVID